MKSTNKTRALAHEILAYWLRFNRHDQNNWVGINPSIKKEKVGTAQVNVCQTTMCAAGTAVFLSVSVAEFLSANNMWFYEDWMNAGGELLGLDSDEANEVFLSNNKSAKRFMRAIASGSQKKFDKAKEKSSRIE